MVTAAVTKGSYHYSVFTGKSVAFPALIFNYDPYNPKDGIINTGLIVLKVGLCLYTEALRKVSTKNSYKHTKQVVQEIISRLHPIKIDVNSVPNKEIIVIT